MNIIARRCQHQWVSWAPQVTVLPINGPDYHQHGNNSKMPFLFFTCTGKSDHLPSQDTTTVELANKNTIFPSLRNYYFFFLNNFSWWSTQGHPHNQCPQWIEVGGKQDNEKKSAHKLWCAAFAFTNKFTGCLCCCLNFGSRSPAGHRTWWCSSTVLCYLTPATILIILLVLFRIV